MQVAAIASGVWALLSVLLAWAMLAPELQRAPTILEVLTRPVGLVLAATIIIPIALFWLLALLIWRAQELKLMSSAMTEVAIRLAEPDRMAEQQIASVGQAVRRQVNFMNDAVARALGRANELEALVHNEVASLERSYNQNEERIRGLLQELSGERNALLNTSDRVNVSLKELGSEVPALIERLGEQQIKLARFIEDAGQNIVALESAINASSSHLASSVGARTVELQAALTEGTSTLQNVLDDRTITLQNVIADRTANLQNALVDQTQMLDQAIVLRTTELDTAISTRTAHFDQALATRTGELDSAITARTASLDTVLSERTTAFDSQIAARTTALETVLTQRTDGLQAQIAERTDEMQAVFSMFSDGLDEALGARTEGLQTVLEEYTRALDATLAGRQQSLDSQLVERTKALDDAFSERLQLFDDSILRSTIAIDSMVADKARALSTALEAHAKDISHVLGRQAGELDEQLMHGVNAVRLASQNVTKQSLKAIEGLAGQADLLKNVSENLVGQISSVTTRFDQQGQTIMRAANALETANYRIDQTLQNRQNELSQTLESLSTKTDEIDRALRGYSTSLEGTISEAEKRARSVGESLTRGAEQRSRLATAEIERLQIEASSETDRALADLRGKFSSMSRDVAQEIGSLSSRFNETSDEMRRRAQSTLAEIDSEQARLKVQLDRLPEATRQSAEVMRTSLQDQLKALEQLSTLSQREAARVEVSPPMALPAAAAQAPVAPRSISAVTQSLANEMAQRTPQAMQQAQPATPAKPATMPPAAMTATPGPGPAAMAAPVPQSQPAPLAPSAPASRPQAQIAAPQPVQQAYPNQGQPLAPGPAAPSPQPLPRAAAPNSHSLAAQPAAGQPPAGKAQAGDGWKLGDLLARASQDEENQRGALNIGSMSRALDPTTASAIWARFRAGQRGVMVRSIYSVEGRTAFDEVQRRYRAEAPFRQTVDAYMRDFEQFLRDADQRDASGRSAQGYIVSDSGRVYLFLAHASGRLA